MLSRIGVLFAITMTLSAVSAPAQAATLRAPALQSPEHGAALNAVPPFTWAAVPRATQYEVQIAADRGFGSIVPTGSFRTRNTAATLQNSLGDGTYYWRVRAIGANDKAGRWSPTRTLEKAWGIAPQLSEPGDALTIRWPARPLALRWSVVPHATKYVVTVATDPSLANTVVGTAIKPLETQGTVYTPPRSLGPGRYYWAITPVDAGNFRGRRSRVGNFSIEWPTATEGRVLDLDPSPQVFDPLLQWDAVPGAAKYEVEVNPTSEFTPGSRLFTGIANGTSVAPTVHLLNNTYHWRVRPIDADNNSGAWTVGPVFKKEYDDVTPTVPNVRIRDHDTADLGGLPTTSEPFFTWSPVPGATQYELQFTRYSAAGTGFCDWSQHFGDAGSSRSAFTANNAWSVGTQAQVTGNPGTSRWPALTVHKNPFLSGQTYCMRILAQDGALNASEWTYVNAEGQPTNPNRPAFAYAAPATGPTTCAPIQMPATAYREPAGGGYTPRTPFFTWDPVAGAAGYFVVVARDAEFTEVIDFAFTQPTIYAPRKSYADETTAYYWAVIPAALPNGSCTDAIGAYRSFEKRSQPPALLGPANGEEVPVQPLFRWSGVESAGIYRLQVGTDPDFGELVDDVPTASTAYASTKAYPADTRLYWRVRAAGLNWSETRSFVRRLPVPAMLGDNPAGGEMIPMLGWTPIQGATSYDLHVDQADGTARDFTMQATSFTPVFFYGTGIWRWKVRANFPGNVSSAYSSSQEYVRRLNAPSQARVSMSRTRMLFTWNPDPAATKYRLQIAASDSFGTPIETINTPLTSFAPLLTSGGYTAGGKLWWRLAIVDSGGNVGAYTTGIVALPRGMTVGVQGFATRRRRGTLTVTVKDTKGRPVRKALVKAAGAGVKGRKRTSKKGIARMTLRPRKRGTITFTVIRRGFRDGKAMVRVR
jgi:hypothetical protein